jgi:hypothetical protein
MDLQAIADQVATSAIVGTFTLLTGIVMRRFKKDNASPVVVYVQPGQFVPPGSFAQPQAAQIRRPSVSFGLVLIHVAILQFVVNVVGTAIGFSVGYIGAQTGGDISTLTALAVLIQILVGTMLLIIGFALVGVIVAPAVRWRHLTYVAIGTAIATLIVNFAFGLRSDSAIVWATDIVTSFVQAFVAMGIGGAISMLFRRSQTAKQPAYSPMIAPASQPYLQGQSLPYPNGSVPPGMQQYPSAQPGIQQYPPPQPGIQHYSPADGYWYPPSGSGLQPPPSPARTKGQ